MRGLDHPLRDVRRARSRCGRWTEVWWSTEFRIATGSEQVSGVTRWDGLRNEMRTDSVALCRSRKFGREQADELSTTGVVAAVSRRGMESHWMTRRKLVRALGCGLAAGLPRAARGQDFGRMLENVARNSIANTFSPEGVERLLTPQSARRDVHGQDGGRLDARGPPIPAHRCAPARRLAGDPLPRADLQRRFWDIDPTVSLAQYLAQAGHDVWAVDLRGCGQSQKWVFRLDLRPDALIGGAIRRATKGKLAPTGFATVDPKYAELDPRRPRQLRPAFAGRGS